MLIVLNSNQNKIKNYLNGVSKAYIQRIIDKRRKNKWKYFKSKTII